MAAPPANREWHDPWQGGAVQRTTSLWLPLSMLGGPAVEANTAIHYSLACVGKGAGVDAHVEVTCTTREVSLQMQKARRHA